MNKTKLLIGAICLAFISSLLSSCSTNDSSANKAYFTVTWVNYDGTVLEIDSNVEEGTIPTYDGETPSKNKTNQFSYTFTGWTPEIEAVEADVTYTALFTETTNTFTITWRNYDGSVLEIDENVAYGTIPTYDGQSPQKQKDAHFTYAFVGWSPEIVNVTSDVTYTAVFNDTVNVYTVSWTNYDGTILEIDSNVPYGTMPVFNSDTPKRASDSQYSYAFTGWSPNVTYVTDDVIYIAEYTNSLRCYTVIWKNYDGSVLETDLNVPYGTMPSFDSASPIKESTAQFSYAFTGWSPEVKNVDADAIYTAQFGESTNTYTVIWKNYDGSVLEIDNNVPYGTFPTYDGDIPIKTSTAQYSYTFTGWSPLVSSVTGDSTYVATFSDSINGYTITWINYDGTVLEKDFNVLYGNIPTYDGATPLRPSTSQYSYVFSGWAPEIKAVTGDATYMAQYSNTLNEYTIIWKNYDGTVLETDLNVPYGTDPSYDGAVPSKEKTQQFSFVFNGWSPEVESVAGDATYVALFREVINQYKVDFINYDGTLLYSTSVDYGTSVSYAGTTPLREDSNDKSYVFKGWSGSLTNIVEDTTLMAQYTVYDVYKFVYFDGSETIIKIIESGDISSLMPNNTPTAISANTETTYSWILDEEYKYIEVPTSRNFYYVTYNLFGGTNHLDNPTKVYSDELYQLHNASKNGYLFDGWYEESTFDTKIDEIVCAQANIDLFAKFIPINYSITYHLDGGTNHIKNPDTITIEDEIDLKDPSKSGYSFDGWYSESTFTNRIYSLKCVSENVILFAKFTPNVYSVSYKSNGGTFSEKLSVTLYGTKCGETKTFLMEQGVNVNPYDLWSPSMYRSGNQGLYFAGWYLDSSCNNLLDSQIVVEEDVSLYAKWNTYSSPHAVIVADGNSQSITALSSFQGQNNPISNCYYYIGANYKNIECSYRMGYKWDDLNMSYSGTTLYCYSYIQKKVIGSAYATYQKTSGTVSIDVVPGDVVTFYWSGTAFYSASLTPKGKINSKIFSSNTHCINQLFDESLNSPSITKKGYTLIGWMDESGNYVNDTYSIPSNQTLTAQWSINEYYIEYNLDGGTNNSDNPNTYTVEDTVTLKPASKPGYTFVGWYTEPSFENEITSFSSEIGNIVLYAKFVINSYSLTLDSNGGYYSPKIQFVSEGQVIDTVYLHQEDTLTSYYPDNKVGFIFGGWYLDEDYTKPFNFTGTICDDMTLYAKWIQYEGDYIYADLDHSKEVSISGKNEQMVAFTPISDGSITVTSSSDLDLVGSLLDSNKNSLITVDDISDTNLNFSFTYNVYAGQTYYISVKGNTVATIGDAMLSIEWSGNTTINGATYFARTITITYEDYFYLPDNVKKDGYVFVGWFDDNGVQYYGGQWFYADSLTLHAVFEQLS